MTCIAVLSRCVRLHRSALCSAWHHEMCVKLQLHVHAPELGIAFVGVYLRASRSGQGGNLRRGHEFHEYGSSLLLSISIYSMHPTHVDKTIYARLYASKRDELPVWRHVRDVCDPVCS